MLEVRVPVSIGELIDKITILEIKLDKFAAPELAGKRSNVATELQALTAVWRALPVDHAAVQDHWAALKAVNSGLWDVEDGKRACEAAQRFDAHFVALARRVYQENDQRAAIKRRINDLLGSAIVEEKSYAGY